MNFELDLTFGEALSDKIQFSEYEVDKVYSKVVDNFLYEHRKEDLKVELVKATIKLRKYILRKLSYFVMKTGSRNKETNEYTEEVVIDGDKLIDGLKKNKWDLMEVYVALTSWRKNLQLFIELEPKDFKTNEDKYMKSQNNLKSMYDGLNTICYDFIEYDVYTQWIKQL
jgi:hypothetical protein